MMRKRPRIAAVTLIISLLAMSAAAADSWQELLVLSDSLFAVNQGDSARVLAESALRLASTDSSAASCWHRIGMCYRWRSDLSAADSCLSRALEIREHTCGPEDPRTGATLHELAWVYKLQGRLNESETAFRRALAIREACYGDCSDPVVRTLEQFGELLQWLGKPQEAIGCFRQVAESYESQPRLLGTAFGRCYEFLGFLLRDQGKFEEAVISHRKAYDYYTRFAPEHVAARANCLNSLAVLCNVYSRYEAAESAARQALELLATIPPNSHVHPPMVAANLGNTLVRLGKFDEAEEALTRQIECQDSIYFRWHVYLLDALAQVHERRGELEKALDCRQRAVAVMDAHPEAGAAAIEPLNELTQFCLVNGFYDQALESANRAVQLCGGVPSDFYPRSAESLLQLAEAHSHVGRTPAADSLLVLVKTMQDSALVTAHPRHAEFISRRARLEARLHHIDRAAESAYEALECAERAYGNTHPELAHYLQLCSAIEAHRENPHAAAELARQAYDLRFTAFMDGVGVLPEPDALTFGSRFREATSQLLSVLMDQLERDSSKSREIAALINNSKSRVLDEFMNRNRVSRTTTDTALVALEDSLRIARFQFANLLVRAHSQTDASKYGSDLDIARKRRNHFEAEVGRQSKQLRTEPHIGQVNPAQIAAGLPDSSALVEFAKYRRVQVTGEDEDRYAAVVVTTNGHIQVFPLGSAARIDSAVVKYRRQVERVDDLRPRQYHTCAGRLYDLVWKPIAQAIGSAHLVYIVPDGSLHRVSFAGLPTSDEQYLIERHAVHYLATGRDLVRNNVPGRATEGLAIFADPDFDAMASSRLAANGRSNGNADSNAAANGLSAMTMRSRLFGPPLKRLPGTRVEAEAVHGQWKVSSEEPVREFYGEFATEDALKACAGGCRVLYLATHGFSSTVGGEQSSPASPWPHYIEPESYANGLCLAGANRLAVDSIANGLEDGMLTMEEVAAMDLAGTDFVILSACESGLGDIESGEGVLGLRRAFQLAGARSVISALWQLDDRTTAEFMAELFARGQSTIADALRAAAIRRLTDMRKRQIKDHPFLWAGLVVSGERAAQAEKFVRESRRAHE